MSQKPSLRVHTTSGECIYARYPEKGHYDVLVNKAGRDEDLHIASEAGSTVFIPHHAISSIVFHPGGK